MIGSIHKNIEIMKRLIQHRSAVHLISVWRTARAKINLLWSIAVDKQGAAQCKR